MSEMSVTENFEAIRAYQDQEVNPVLMSLLQDTEFLSFIASQQFPRLHSLVPTLVRKRVQRILGKEFKHINSVQAWQQQLAPYVEKLVNNTVEHFSVSGLEHLKADQRYVFISNHRDIAMDPTLLNMALLQGGFKTSKVAIGDNLLGREFVAKLMRLNKSFVVPRSVSGKREKIQAMQNLSAYIHTCLKQQQHIWIAQKEGRAKDGVDLTDASVLKMMHLAGRKLGWELSQSMAFLNIVPVCISYEWDPCDVDKAKELVALAQGGQYEKAQDEDFVSIVKGLKGQKGRVHVHFSQPLNEQGVKAFVGQQANVNHGESWAQSIDGAIHGAYAQFQNQALAHELLQQQDFQLPRLWTDRRIIELSEQFGSNTVTQWQRRFESLSTPLYECIIKYYSQGKRP